MWVIIIQNVSIPLALETTFQTEIASVISFPEYITHYCINLWQAFIVWNTENIYRES